MATAAPTSEAYDEAFVIHLQKVTRWIIRKWYDHPDWEDLQQEAWIAAWQVAQNRGTHCWRSMRNAAAWVVSDYVRGPQAFHKIVQEGRVAPKIESIQALMEQRLELELPGMVVKDFAPDLLEQLDQQELVRMTLRLATPREKKVIALRYGAGWEMKEIAKALKMTVNNADQLQSLALNRVRMKLGIPERGWTREKANAKIRRRRAKKAALAGKGTK